ncbi:MAG TPA: hypothetical protein DEP70_06680 [Acholeplasmataceae bacterium]|nr:hypothetical protein [Acholeplasmataceae bacterium]
MKLDSALTFLNNFKIIVTRKSIIKGLFVNLFIAIFVLILFFRSDIVSIVICTSIVLLNVVFVSIFNSKKFWSFSNSFLIFSINLATILVLLNYAVYGFQKQVYTNSYLFLMIFILLQIVITFVFFISKYLNILHEKTKKYNPVPTYAGIGSLGSFLFVKIFLRNVSESVGFVVSIIAVSIVILALCYIIAGQLIPRYYITKKFNILEYDQSY